MQVKKFNNQEKENPHTFNAFLRFNFFLFKIVICVFGISKTIACI